MTLAGKEKNRLLPLILGFGVLLVGAVMPDYAGITAVGWRALSILVFAIVFWATEAVKSAVTGMAILVLLPLTGILDYQDTFSSMGTVMVWRLVAMFMITEAIQRVGLADRLAYRIILWTKGNTRRILFYILMMDYFFVFIIPSSLSRTVLLSAIAVSLFHAANIKFPSNIAKALMIAIPVVAMSSSATIIVGASVDIFAANLFEALVGYKWTYVPWMIVNLPTGLAATLITYFVVLKLFKPEREDLSEGMATIREKLEALGEISRQEIFVMICFIAMFIFWFTDTAEVIPAEMLIAFILLLPQKKPIMTWKQSLAVVNWDVVILFGASVSLARALQKSEVIAYIAQNVFSGLAELSPIVVGLVVVVLTMVVRLGMSNMTGAVATLLPLVITVAGEVGVNPVWLGMLCVSSSTVCFFFPAQSPNVLCTYAYGYFDTKDLLKFGLLMSPFYTGAILLIAYFYWPLANLSIFN